MLPLVLTKSLELFIDIGSRLFSVLVLIFCSFFTSSTFVSVSVLIVVVLLLLLLLLVVVLVVMMLVLVLGSG